MVQPGLGRRVTVLLRDLGGGEIVEGPHALVGSGRAAQRDHAQGHQGSGTDGLHGSLTGKTGQRIMRALTRTFRQYRISRAVQASEAVGVAFGVDGRYWTGCGLVLETAPPYPLCLSACRLR